MFKIHFMRTGKKKDLQVIWNYMMHLESYWSSTDDESGQNQEREFVHEFVVRYAQGRYYGFTWKGQGRNRKLYMREIFMRETFTRQEYRLLGYSEAHKVLTEVVRDMIYQLFYKEHVDNLTRRNYVEARAS